MERRVRNGKRERLRTCIRSLPHSQILYSIFCILSLCPFHVLARIRIHDNFFALIDEDRNANRKARINRRFLGDITSGRIAFDGRHRLRNRKCHLLRNLQSDRLAFKKAQHDRHAILQILRLITNRGSIHGNLLIARRIHKVVSNLILVEVLHIAILHFDDRNGLGDLYRLFERAAVADILNAATHECRALARIDMLELRDNPRVIIEEEDDAFLDFVWRSHSEGRRA